MDTNFKKIILEKVNLGLKSFGFKMSGCTFQLKQEDSIIFVQLQSSQKSTKDKLVVTINLGILSLPIFIKERYTRKPTILDSHWRERIGYLIPEHYDKWWEIQSCEEALKVSEELSDLLSSKVILEIKQIASTDKLKMLWISGKSPGLTEFQRKEFLKLLNNQ